MREAPRLMGPGHDEIKNDQWLGVSVKSQRPGGKVVVCAHRYIQSSNLTLYHYGMGLCYLLTNNLGVEEALEPCKGRPTEKLHQQFGYCQVGTSLAMLDDGFAVMGSPGPYTWRGTIFAQSVVGDFLEKDKIVYKGPLSDTPEPINKYSYLGMSVTGGRFFDRKVLTYVSGAPRSNLVGQVFFFDKTKSIEELGIHLIINGTQFGSSFGYEILAVDIDQDGLDEFLVSAPFFYEKDKGGAVYLYNDLTNCRKDSCKAHSVWTGKAESRFGFSMTSLGDINKDGYRDVAIGAPYEERGGAVYIYLGDRKSLQREPSQIIKIRNFKTVGYSLSGGIDMDLNDYPDLLVGAYESDRVILFKTRPIIDIRITVEGNELKNINATRKGCEQDPDSDKTCFSFQTCFTLSEFRLTQAVEVIYEIKELTKKIRRVTFGNNQNTVNDFREFINVTDVSKNYCVDKVAYLVEGNGDIVTPIKFQVNYTLHEDAIDSPILNRTSVKTFEATFQKNCGSDDVCKSNLVLTAGIELEKSGEVYVLKLGAKKEIILEANVTNHGESAYEAKLFVSHPEGLSYVALQSEKNKTSNIICTSYNDTTLVTCNLGNPYQENQAVTLRFRFEVRDIQEEKIALKVSVNSTSEELSKQTSQTLGVSLQKLASYEIKGETKSSNTFYSGEVKGESAMRHLQDIGPRIIHTYTVHNQGWWNIRDMQVVIRWPYQVYTERKEGGKWLLYLEKEPVIDWNATNYCTVDPQDSVNPLHLNSSGVEPEPDEEDPYATGDSTDRRKPQVRRKRDVADVIPSQVVTDSEGKQRRVVSMNCTLKTARCARITCHIAQLSEYSQVSIKIFSRLWNSTLREDYSQVDRVIIGSSAEVIIADKSIIHSKDSKRSAEIPLTAYAPVDLIQTGVNIWIIVGAVLAGLLLLIIVIVLLYKCGFFKRNRIKDHTLSGNLRKKGENETLLTESEKKQAKPM
jgi:integrin alpha 7